MFLEVASARVVANLLFELLQREAEVRMNQAEQQPTMYLASLDIPSLDAAIFRARKRHPEPKEDRACVWAFLMQEKRQSRDSPGHEDDLLVS